ncbi:MAG TPA: hypothetical protein VFF49_02590 [Thermodesulfobacteriota bacterium]|nr:hypothetical protein [Thermodesulfobacteriota bacterium]
MYLRRINHKQTDGNRRFYWALVESYRTERGPRQRVVAYIGESDEAVRLGIKQAAEGKARLGDEVYGITIKEDYSKMRKNRNG